MLHLLSIFFVCSGVVIAIIIGNDLNRNKQSMKIMNAVWILTALWASYLALWAYYKFGREKMNLADDKSMKMDMAMDDMNMPMDNMNMPMDDMNMGNSHSKWQSVALSALHCGAGCTLADIIGEWFTYYIPISIGGSPLIGNWVLDFVLALIIGVYFQFYAIREMEKISVGEGLSRAFKADFFSLTSWQVGMYGWMAVVYFVLSKELPIAKDTWTFWFMMQVAMLFGFLCAYPMNALLIRIGVKKGM